MLGDLIHKALKTCGITDDRVAQWLGKSCSGCKERRDKLNRLTWWAIRVLSGKGGDYKPWETNESK
jgi:hypothetical protein